eukprot:jgi/Botrbrau1/10282/Bobra.0120s0004.1
MPSKTLRNPQTLAFLDMLDLPYNLPESGAATKPGVPEQAIGNPEEIDLGEEDDEGSNGGKGGTSGTYQGPEAIGLAVEAALASGGGAAGWVPNPEEVDLPDDWED